VLNVAHMAQMMASMPPSPTRPIPIHPADAFTAERTSHEVHVPKLHGSARWVWVVVAALLVAFGAFAIWALVLRKPM
jgi:hypothetical protein